MDKSERAAIGFLVMAILALVFANNAFAQAWTYTKPVCFPNPINGELRYGQYDTILYGFWYCDTPRGIRSYARAGNVNRGIPSRNWTGRDVMALFAFDAWIIKRELTATEKDVINKLPDRIAAKVAPNSGRLTAPIYRQNADGTKGVKIGDVPIASECNWSDRLIRISFGKEVGTDYYLVADKTGELYFSKTKLYGYARCTIMGTVSK